MACSICDNPFSQIDSGLAEKVDKAAPACACESVSASLYSPGPVQAEETLIRFVVHPFHFQAGSITSTLFSDSETTGSSVFRAKETPNDVLRAEAQKVVSRASLSVSPIMFLVRVT